LAIDDIGGGSGDDQQDSIRTKPINPSTLSSIIRNFLTGSLADWVEVEQTDIRKVSMGEIRTDKYVAVVQRGKKKFDLVQYPTSYNNLRIFKNQKRGSGGSGGSGQSSNTVLILAGTSSESFVNTDPTVCITTPKTKIIIKLTDKTHVTKNIVFHTVLEGETAESIIKQITGKSDLSAIIEMTPTVYHVGDKVLSGYQLKIENGLMLKISGTLTNSKFVIITVTGAINETKTIHFEEAGTNVIVGWDAEFPIQESYGLVKIEASSGGLSAFSEPEIAEPNWVDIEYKVEGQSFSTEGVVILRFDDGTTLRGTLDNGLSHFPLVPFMPFSVKFEPSDEKQKELDKLYVELDTLLTEKVAEAKKEAQTVTKIYEKLPWFIKNKVNEFYTLKGAGHWVVDTATGLWTLVSGAAKVIVQSQVWMAEFHLRHLKIGTCAITGDQECVKAESKQIETMMSDVGEDASSFSESAKTIYYLANDGKTGKRLEQFGKDYFNALSVPEQHQFVTRYGIDILLLFVGGSGAALLGIKNASKITAIIKKIADVLKTFPTKVKFKKTKGDVNNKNTFPPKLKYSGSLPGKAKPGLPRKDIDESGWPILPAKEAANFTNVEAKLLTKGTIIYRVIENDSSAAGSYWAYKLPKSKTEWRTKYAVLDDWNDNGKYVEYIVKEKNGLKVWSGETAGQNIGKNGPHYPGGDEQIWIPRNYVSPSASKPTNW